MPAFSLDTPVGKFTLRPDRGGFRLSIDGEPVGWFSSAENACQDVEARATGFHEWDSQPPEVAEATVGAWDVVR